MIALASAPWGGIGKEPSLPTNDNRADGVFNLVVADFNLTMLKKAGYARINSPCSLIHAGVFLSPLLLYNVGGAP